MNRVLSPPLTAFSAGLALLLLALPTSSRAQRPAIPVAKSEIAVTPPSGRHIPIVAAGFERERPVGLFYRLYVDFMSGNRVDLRTLLFLAGNRITRTYPSGGGDAFDKSRCNPDVCGSYQHEMGLVVVRWDNGQVDHWPYRKTAEGFELDGNTYKPARPLTESALIGTWSGAANTGNASENVYRFDSNGTFTFGAVRTGVAGRYSINGMALTLAFADGTQQRRTLFGAGSSKPVGLISVDGDVYRRQ